MIPARGAPARWFPVGSRRPQAPRDRAACPWGGRESPHHGQGAFRANLSLNRFSARETSSPQRSHSNRRDTDEPGTNPSQATAWRDIKRAEGAP